MPKKLITVVIPVYNAQQYIERTIESAISQTLRQEHFEIIAVNDGSTDDSLQKLYNLQNQYPEILTIINQKNAGAGRARNSGLNAVKTPYVCFLDADDTLELDFLEKMLQLIEEQNADVAICGFKRVSSTGEVLQTYIPARKGSYRKYTSMLSTNRIHRMAFLNEKQIRFYENTFVEDTPFSLEEIMKGGKYAFTDYVGYNWTLNPESFSSTGLSVCESLKSQQAVELLKVFIEIGKHSKFDKDFQYFMIKGVFHQLLRQGRNGTSEDFMRHYRFSINSLKEEFPEALSIKKIWLAPQGESFKVGAVVSTMFMLHRIGMMKICAKLLSRKVSTGREENEV